MLWASPNLETLMPLNCCDRGIEVGKGAVAFCGRNMAVQCSANRPAVLPDPSELNLGGITSDDFQHWFGRGTSCVAITCAPPMPRIHSCAGCATRSRSNRATTIYEHTEADSCPSHCEQPVVSVGRPAGGCVCGPGLHCRTESSLLVRCI